MTVASTNSSQVFSGGQSVLTFTFQTVYNSPSNILVNVTALTGGTVTALVYNVGYTVSLNSSGIGGTVTILPSYSTAYNYTVYRSTPILQSSQYANYNNFPAATLMASLDQLTMIAQEISDGLIGPQGPVGPAGSNGSVTLVSSSTADVTVVSTSTTPIITAVNAFTGGASTILRLDSSGKLPFGLDGSQLINVISSIKNYGVSTGSSTAISASSLKICYGYLTGITTAGTQVINLPFTSATSYVVMVTQNATALTANGAPIITSNSSGAITTFYTSSGGGSDNATWFGIGT